MTLGEAILGKKGLQDRLTEGLTKKTQSKAKRKPKKITPRKCPLEHQEQKAFVQWLKAKGLLYHSIPNGNSLSSLNRNTAQRVGAKMKSEGMIAGASDIVVFTPKKILYIEMKRQLKSESTVAENQKVWMEKVNQYPYATAMICYGAREAIKNVEKYL